MTDVMRESNTELPMVSPLFIIKDDIPLIILQIITIYWS